MIEGRNDIDLIDWLKEEDNIDMIYDMRLRIRIYVELSIYLVF